MPLKQWNHATVVTAAESVVDADDRDARRARRQHGEQGGDAFECTAVTGARGHGDHRSRRDTAHDTRQGTFHPGDGDDDVGSGEFVDVGEQAMKAGDAGVVDAGGTPAVRLENRCTLFSHGEVGCAGRDDHDGVGARTLARPLARPPHDGGSSHYPVRRDRQRGLHVVGAGSREHNGAVVSGEELGHDRGHLLGRLARRVHGLWESLAQRAVMIDAREAEIGERKAAQSSHGFVG